MNRIIHDESLYLLQSPFYAFTMPLVYSIFSGLSVFFFIASIGFIIDYPNVWQIAFCFFCLVQSSIWLVVVSRWLLAFHRVASAVAPSLETKDAANLTLWLPINNSPNNKHRYDLPIDQIGLHQLAVGINAGKTFSESSWVGRKKLFRTRNPFITLRDKMLEQDLLAWRSLDDPTRGVYVTDLGKELFDSYLNYSPIEGAEIIDM